MSRTSARALPADPAHGEGVDGGAKPAVTGGRTPSIVAIARPIAAHPGEHRRPLGCTHRTRLLHLAGGQVHTLRAPRPDSARPACTASTPRSPSPSPTSNPTPRRPRPAAAATPASPRPSPARQGHRQLPPPPRTGQSPQTQLPQRPYKSGGQHRQTRHHSRHPARRTPAGRSAACSVRCSRQAAVRTAKPADLRKAGQSELFRGIDLPLALGSVLAITSGAR